MKIKLLTLLLLLRFSISFSQNVVLKESKISFKTYPFSDPNAIPKMGNIYPYFRFDGYTNTALNKDWKVVEMENDFIKVTILPEIGGKIWGAYEKSKNFPFVYYNHVVKFRDIAMRGAWTSGGIEINFGDIGHAPSTATPVDYTTRLNTDGSASCFLSATDWTTGTCWTVEVNLQKDKAFFTTKSTWYNASPLETSYYHWMNAGYKAQGNLEFNFEGSHFIGHEGEVGGWKKDDEGHEINFYEKNNFGTYKSYHVTGKKSDFYGGYWHDDQMGMGHFSNYDEKLGKKIWVWGLSRQGMIWENLLTDTDGQYVELQSGRLFNQAAANSINSPYKHLAFEPNNTETWTEYWFPVNGTKGIANATEFGAINFADNKIYFSPLQNISDSLKIYSDNKLIYSQLINLKPLEKWEIDFVKKEKLSVFIGKNKVFNEAEKIELARPKLAPKNFNWESEYGLYLKGKDLANQRNYSEAIVFLNKSLAKNPNLLPALTASTQIYYQQAEFQKAFETAYKALSINTYDGQANYLWGLINTEMGKNMDAVDGFSVASLSPNYRSASLLNLAKHYAKNKNWVKALEFAKKCENEFPLNIDNQNLLLVINRKMGNNIETQISLDLAQNPLNHYVRAEKYLINGDKKQLSDLITNEFPQYTYIQIADWYSELGLYDEALKILALSPEHALVHYRQAYLKNLLNLPYQISLKKAVEMPLDFVFPNKNHEIKVLNWAENQMPSFKTKYYLALIYWHKNRLEEAQKYFNSCGDEPNTVFLLAKASLFKNDKTIAKNSLQKAYNLQPNNWRAAKALVDYLIENKNYKQALEIAEKAIGNSPENYILGQNYAQLLAYNQRFTQSIEYLKTLNILPNEGASDAYGLFREVNILQAIEEVKSKNYVNATKYLNEAETYPENLGSGIPYNPDNKFTNKMKKAIAEKIKLKSQKSLPISYPYLGKTTKEKEAIFWNKFAQNFK